MIRLADRGCDQFSERLETYEMTGPVFILKVALAGRKSVWRRIALRGEQTLDNLHETIFNAFDRDDEHLYSFYFPRPGTKGRARLRDAVEYACPFSCKDAGPFSDDVLPSAAKTAVSSLGLKPGQVFLYLFDFGDNWLHEITVEQTDVPAGKGKYPRVVEKHGKSPRQYPDTDEE
ncbi:MAG: plasmid pRiA4b ORF-3 family protein [Thermoguttaceae bacterium]